MSYWVSVVCNCLILHDQPNEQPRLQNKCLTETYMYLCYWHSFTVDVLSLKLDVFRLFTGRDEEIAHIIAYTVTCTK